MQRAKRVSSRLQAVTYANTARNDAQDQRPDQAWRFMKTAKLTVWFDGGCPLCRREVALFRLLDRRAVILFEDISQPDSVCPIDREQMLVRFHAQEKGAPIVSGAAAFAAMWRAIPVLRPFGELARIPAALWGLERLYQGFLKVRPRLQQMIRWFEPRLPASL